MSLTRKEALAPLKDERNIQVSNINLPRHGTVFKDATPVSKMSLPLNGALIPLKDVTNIKELNHSPVVRSSLPITVTQDGVKTDYKLQVSNNMVNVPRIIVLKNASNTSVSTSPKFQIARGTLLSRTPTISLPSSNGQIPKIVFTKDKLNISASNPSGSVKNLRIIPRSILSSEKMSPTTGVPSSLAFESKSVSVSFSEGQNLPKTVFHNGPNTSSALSQFTKPFASGVTLRKIPNRQKSLSLQKSKIVSKAIMELKENRASSDLNECELGLNPSPQSTDTVTQDPLLEHSLCDTQDPPELSICETLNPSFEHSLCVTGVSSVQHSIDHAVNERPDRPTDSVTQDPLPEHSVCGTQDLPEHSICETQESLFEHSSMCATPDSSLKHSLAVDESPDRLREILENMLPPNYSHHISAIEPVKLYHSKEYDESAMFMAVLRVDIKTKEEALKWVDEYTYNSFTDWRVRRTFKENTKLLVFKKVYRCHNNTMSQYRKGNVKPHKKHTECDAALHVTVRNLTESADPHLKKYPTEIVIHHCHNHPLEAADNLKYRRPTVDLKEKFGNLFRSGHSPSSALHTHQYDLQIDSGDNFFKVLADGVHCPNLQWCFNLYRRTFSQDYGAPSGEGMLSSLKSAVLKYNEQCGSVCASVQVVEDNDIVVALCTPLMKRVHKLKSSAEMAFLDSGGCMDRQNNRVFTLLAHSPAGALPEGLIITSSETEKVIHKGLEMLMDIAPPDAFGGRGSRGPEMIMTDDCASERNALKLMFPEITPLLCLFHVLQAMWRFIWDSKHNVHTNDKLEVYTLFRELCYEENEEEFKTKFECMLAHPKVRTNSGLVKHFREVYERAPEWALAYRVDLLTRGNNTNNYSEATVRQIKENVLQRLKAYSEVQLFDFFVTRLEAYFERRLAMVLNGRQENYWKSKHFIHPSKLVPLRCEKSTTHDGFYFVKNVERNTDYIVDMKHEVCSCPVGRNGAPCKHQLAVVHSFNISSTQFFPVDLESKLALHQVMTTVAPPAEWYAPLHGGPGFPTGEAAAVSSENMCDNSCPEETTSTTDDIGIEESEQPGNVNATYDQTKLSAALKKWEDINAYMVNSMKLRPDLFVDAVEKFSTKFQRAKEASENQLLSAFHTFNQQGVGHRSAVRKYINVNNTSVQRRKQPSLAGRKCTQQGRPPKSRFTSEHGYSSQVAVKTPAWNRLPTKRTALPHNLSHKVAEQSAPKKPRRK